MTVLVLSWPHHRPALNQAVVYGSSGRSEIISGFQLSAILPKPSPAEAAATSNPHRRQGAFPRVRSSEAFRRRPYTGSTACVGPASETLTEKKGSFKPTGSDGRTLEFV